MSHNDHFESLKKMSPLEAVRAWLEGSFCIGDEPALLEAIRKEPGILLTDDEITELMCDAMDAGWKPQKCLDRLAGGG